MYGAATPPPANLSDNGSSSKGDSNEHPSYRSPQQPCTSPRQKTRSKRPQKTRIRAVPYLRDGKSIAIQVQLDRRDLERLLQEQQISSSSDKF
jgi:hypothetical protein